MLDDSELMLAVKQGDLQAFEQIVLRYQSVAWRAAYRFCGDRTAAQDIAQEAFLRILDAVPEYTPSASFKTYLLRVVAHLCIDYARKKQPEFTEDLPEPASRAPAAEGLLMMRERWEKIQAALNRLTPEQRIVIILRYYEDLRYQEIAAIMKTSEKSVERLLARGRSALEHDLARFLEE